MADETILVVDDTPVNLKLAAAVLRSEGYRVHLASNAEQALVMLKTLQPDLLLVDIQLPGMSGLELAQRVRKDSRTANMIVVALTASQGQDLQERAFEAGCDGFITKPIDTRTLGKRMRTFLEGQTVPDVSSAGGTPIASTLATILGPELDGLRRSFLTDAIRETRRMLEFIDAGIDSAAAARLFHQWVGAAGALGYMEIAEAARRAETILGTTNWTKSDLREILTNLAELLAKPREASETPIPDAIVQQLTRKRVALVGFAEAEADRVCEAFERVRAMPYLFETSEPGDSAPVRACAVVIVHVREETMNSPWLQPGFAAPAEQPWVLLGGREQILALDPKVQSRAVEYLIDGWQPEEVIMRLSFAVSRAEAAAAGASGAPVAAPVEAEPERRPVTGKPEILIVDDDAHVRAVVQSTLQNLGMDVRSASSGPEALRLARELRPHAAVLDVNMPDMDGFEVLAAIRKEKLPIHVVMLTARQHEQDVLRGFELGADDYVVKPFNPMEVVARLKRLLR